MSNHVFHPSTQLAAQVLGYAHGLKAHKDHYGDVPGNSPAELRPLEAEAEKLVPMAKKIEDLELQLGALREQYNRAALPLWREFSEKLGLAQTHAEKQDKAALLTFIGTFRHHHTAHRAAQQASALPHDGAAKK